MRWGASLVLVRLGVGRGCARAPKGRTSHRRERAAVEHGVVPKRVAGDNDGVDMGEGKGVSGSSNVGCRDKVLFARMVIAAVVVVTQNQPGRAGSQRRPHDDPYVD